MWTAKCRATEQESRFKKLPLPQFPYFCSIMWHFNSKTTKIWAHISVFIPVFIYGLMSCGGGNISENRAESIRGTDSLWVSLQEIRSRFGYKINEIDERRHVMDSVLQWLKFAKEKDITNEIRPQILQYNSVFRIYRDFAPKYKKCVLKAEELFYEIKALDKQVKAGNFDNDLPAFGKEYRKLRGQLTNLKIEVEEVLGRLNAVEPTYRRIADPVEGFAESMH